MDKELIQRLVEMMLEDLKIMREKGDFKTASNYYSLLHKLALDHDEVHENGFWIILEELPKRYRNRIIRRLKSEISSPDSTRP